MAYELFLNVLARPSREEIDRAMSGLDTLAELEDFEVHELEDVARQPEEYVEDLEWLLQVEPGFRERYRAFGQQHGLNSTLGPIDPAVATRFMEALGGFDFVVARFPDSEELQDEDAPADGREAVSRGYQALARFAKAHGYRLVDPQFNDPGDFVDVSNPGELPPGYG